MYITYGSEIQLHQINQNYIRKQTAYNVMYGMKVERWSLQTSQLSNLHVRQYIAAFYLYNEITNVIFIYLEFFIKFQTTSASHAYFACHNVVPQLHHVHVFEYRCIA